MLDDDILFFGSLNCLNISQQVNNSTAEHRLVLQFLDHEKLFETVKEGGQSKARLNLLKKFVQEYNLVKNYHENRDQPYELMFDLEFFGFLRKPERIHVDRLNSSYRVIMSLNNELFVGEDRNIAKAVHKCAKLIYPNFRKHKLKEIPHLVAVANKELADKDMMKIAEAQDKATLKKFRPYIENSKVILVDLEGDQLGPNGIITYIQINTFDTAMCFLIDIKLIGDDELRKPDGWLRKMFENPEQAIIMFGGLQDAANLYASYNIRVECMVDLQVVEVHYREALKESAFIQYHQKNPTGSKIPLSLENVYKYFVEDPTLIQYKADQAQHKTNYHVWADRPISPTLKNYAAFDVASMRPVLQVFTKACKLYQWGVLESAICKSRLTCVPKVKTCFTCLRTQSIDVFSNCQRKNTSGHCRSCDETGLTQMPRYEPDQNENEEAVLRNEKIGTGLDGLDGHPRIRLNQTVS